MDGVNVLERGRQSCKSRHLMINNGRIYKRGETGGLKLFLTKRCEEHKL